MDLAVKIWALAGVTCLILAPAHAANEPLRIVVSGEKPGIASVFVANGDEINVLHAPAALGTAVYKRDGKRWKFEDLSIAAEIRMTLPRVNVSSLVRVGSAKSHRGRFVSESSAWETS
jgi:hypothetical protein